MIIETYCVGKVHNMLPWWYYDNGSILCMKGHTICYLGGIMIIGAYCVGKYTICYLSSIMIFGAYCVGKVHNMLPWWYYDNGSIPCR